MRVGIFARTFARPTFDGVLDAVQAYGLEWVQFNFACAGLPTVPPAVERELCDKVRQTFAARGLRMAAISGTINLAHPDPAHRAEAVHRLLLLIPACAWLGTQVVTP